MKPRHRARPEDQIQRACFQHLAWRGVPGLFAFHPANGGWRSPVEARIFKGLGVVAGVPDIIIIHGCQIYALELKADDGRVTDAQLACHERLRTAGARVGVAFGIDRALRQLSEWGLSRPDSLHVSGGRT
jgi:hypothetical protein